MIKNKNFYMACVGAFLLAALGCSDGDISGSSEDPNVLTALGSSSSVLDNSSSSFWGYPDGQPRLCRVSEMENAPAGCDWFAEMWNPESGNRVHTGFDNGTNTSGIWYWELDTNELLIPSVQWVGTAQQGYDSLAMSNVIERCGGSICGASHFNAIDDGENRFNYEFVGTEKPASVDIAFSMAGKNVSGRFDEVDVSGLGGFCVGYESSGLITMYLDFNDSVNALLDTMTYKVILDRTTINGKSKASDYREECFAWADFSRYGSVLVHEAAVSIEDAIKHLVGVHFKMDGYYNKSAITFKIVRFGRFANANGRKALDGENLPTVDGSCISPAVVENFCECNYVDSGAVIDGLRLGHSYAVEEAKANWGEDLSARNNCVNMMWMRSTLEMPLMTAKNLPCDNAQPKIMQCADGSYRFSQEFASVKSRYDAIAEENALARKRVLLDRVDSCLNLSSSSAGASSSSYFFPCCTAFAGSNDLWNGEIAFVDVEDFIESPRNDVEYGYLFWETDSADGGTSTIRWPVKLGNVFSAESMDPVIDYCGGLCGTAVLNHDSLPYNPFVTVGFWLGEEYMGKPISVDVSSWGGLCISYSSEVSPALELDLGDSLNALLGWALPFASLPKSVGVVEKCFKWSNFKLPSWVKSLTAVDQDWLEVSGWLDSAGVMASKQLVKVNIKMQASPGEYDFSIRAIGTNRQ